MKVIFLDIDGVLNNYNSLSFCRGIDVKNMAVLKKILKESEAKIVISSYWRLSGLDFVIEALKEYGIDEADIIDMTPIIRYVARGYEIQAWLDEKGQDVSSFVILDDIDNMVHLTKYLVHTDEKVGLVYADYEKAMNILKQQEVEKNEKAIV